MGQDLRNPYVLFCAGEDSGDILGESFVKVAVDVGLDVCGAGGSRMQKAGMRPLVDFSRLPVSGFGDVLVNYLPLRKSFDVVCEALRDEKCVGLVAIDYPGFNMRLAEQARRMNKPVLYVAPPQVWAWKSGRAKKLQDVLLAVFFDFEVDAYRKHGCVPHVMRHPISVAECLAPESKSGEVLLLPGSRLAQASRNLRCFLKSAVQSCGVGSRVTVLASRKNLVKPFEKIVSAFLEFECSAKVSVEVAPESSSERLARYRSAALALVCPGTATLEAAFAGVPMVVCTQPDPLTYVLGKMLVRSKVFALPNIIVGKKRFPEYIASPFASQNVVCKNMKEACAWIKENPADDVAGILRSALCSGESAQELMLEFLGEFVQR